MTRIISPDVAPSTLTRGLILCHLGDQFLLFRCHCCGRLIKEKLIILFHGKRTAVDEEGDKNNSHAAPRNQQPFLSRIDHLHECRALSKSYWLSGKPSSTLWTRPLTCWQHLRSLRGPPSSLLVVLAQQHSTSCLCVIDSMIEFPLLPFVGSAHLALSPLGNTG